MHKHRSKETIYEPEKQGKTLSLLCSALTWLSDERERAKKGKLKEVVGDDGIKGRSVVALFSPFTMLIRHVCVCVAKDWVIEQTIDRMRREMEADEQEYEQRLMKARKREEAMRRVARGRVTKRMVMLDILCMLFYSWCSLRKSVSRQIKKRTTTTIFSSFLRQIKNPTRERCIFLQLYEH